MYYNPYIIHICIGCEWEDKSHLFHWQVCAGGRAPWPLLRCDCDWSAELTAAGSGDLAAAAPTDARNTLPSPRPDPAPTLDQDTS